MMTDEIKKSSFQEVRQKIINSALMFAQKQSENEKCSQDSKIYYPHIIFFSKIVFFQTISSLKKKKQKKHEKIHFIFHIYIVVFVIFLPVIVFKYFLSREKVIIDSSAIYWLFFHFSINGHRKGFQITLYVAYHYIDEYWLFSL